MDNGSTRQAIISTQTKVDPNRAVEHLAVFNADGSPVELGADGADGTDGVDALAAVITVAGLIGTAAKTTTAVEPVAGSLVPIKFTSGNSAAAVTVAFNGGTARAVLLGGSANADIELTLAADGIAFFYFDGTNLHQVGVVS